MALRDIANDIIPEFVSIIVANINAAQTSLVIDTNHYDDGLMFFSLVTPYDDGIHVFGLEESDDLSGWTVVPEEKLILPDGIVTITGGTTPQEILPRFGAFSTKQYVRQIITTTGVTGTGATFYLFATKKAELKPVQ
ncbi:MAG: hypothetical protein KAS32_09550 [Candidatus Peribacteraceae bacterium]|nr:hypothetical protein [Candidatus Peribacteraceae bacterium]